MKSKSTKHISISEHLILLGIGLAALYWILESVLHVFVFHEGALTEQILGPDPNEIWMRLLIMSLIIMFSVYAQITITKRKQAAALFENEERLRTIFDCAQSGIVIIDASTHVIGDLNPAAAKMIGAARDQIVAKVCHRFICPSEEGQCPISDLGQTIDYSECVLVKANGRTIPILKTATSTLIGGHEHIVESWMDISERKKAEKELQESHKKYETVVENISDVVFQLSPLGFIQYVSPKVQKLYGYKPEDLIGKHLKKTTPMSEVPKAVAVLKRVLSGEKVENLEINQLDYKGKIIPMEISFSSLKKDGKVIAVQGVMRDITERKQAEKEIRRIAAELTQLIDTANAPIFAIDKEGLVNEWNRKVAEITGFNKDEVLGKNLVEDYVTEGHKDAVKDVLDKALKGEEIANYGLPLYTKDKKRIMVLLNATTRRDSSGNIIGVVGIGQDITEQKKIQDELQKRTHDLGERVKEVNCLYGISNLVQKEGVSLEKILEGTVNLISPSWQYPEITCARITLEDQGFKTDNFRETAWKQTGDIVVHGKQVGTLEVCYLEERPESYEGPFLKEERSLINAIVERLGRIIDHRNIEKELRIKEEAIASSINAIVLADLEGNLTYVNRSFFHMWEYDEDKEVIGKRVAELFQEEEKALKIMEVLRKKKGWTGELVARRKDGSTFDVQLLASIVRDKVGEAICVMASLLDITERKKIEQMKDDFVSLASHELRTPLTSIGGYAELMLDGDVGEINKEQKEFLEIISQNTRRLEALISDVLDIEKIESGRIKLKREKVNLNEIVEASVNTFKVMAEGKGLKLEKEIEAVQMDMLGDSDRLSQVLSNLLSNAIKYTKKGKVKVTAQTKGKFASVTIEDTGVGMSEDELRSVFTRFFRSDDSYVRNTTGTGLGLSIVKATVERHNGDIRIESKLGVGTKFEVILPLLKEAKKGD